MDLFDTIARAGGLSFQGLKVNIRRHRCIDCGYMWHQTRSGDKYVTVIVDNLTPIRVGTGGHPWPPRPYRSIEGTPNE